MRMHRKQARKGTLVSCLIRLVAFTFILIVIKLLSISSIWLRIGWSDARSSNGLKQTVVHGSETAIARSDINCQKAKEKVMLKKWVDPNEGKVWARETVTHPQFYISVHAQEYDPVRWRIMEEGKYYEDDVHNRFVQILEHVAPSYVLDIGANIGYYTLLSASLGHTVISFEPNPANVLRLCDSLRLNGFSSTGSPEVYIFQNAVSDEHGLEMMLHSPRNPGQAFLRPLVEGEETDSHTARTTVVKLDVVAEEQGWFERSNFKIKILKIDVEGKEPQVIMGSPKLLQSGIIEEILMEGRRFGRINIRSSFELLFESGYSIKEPRILITGQSHKEKAISVCQWYIKKLGDNSMVVEDMWWTRVR